MFSSSKVFKSSKVEEDELDDSTDNNSKPGLFYSPPKPKFAPSEGRGRTNTSGSDSSITQLIIPEEDGPELHILEQPEGKYSNRDARHSSRHKHRRRERLSKGGEFHNFGLGCYSIVPSLSMYSTCQLFIQVSEQTTKLLSVVLVLVTCQKEKVRTILLSMYSRLCDT